MQSIRNVRKAHDLLLQHAAAGKQVNPATLSRIERLEQIPSIDLAERLANFLRQRKCRFFIRHVFNVTKPEWV